MPPPYAGTLTIPMVMYAGTQVHPFDAWDDATRLLEKLAGKPTETHGDYSCWAAEEGDKCAYFCIEKTSFEKLKREGKKGPAVGSTDTPFLADPSSPSGNREECKKRLAKKK